MVCFELAFLITYSVLWIKDRFACRGLFMVLPRYWLEGLR
jgi:hypothetical protein